MEHCIMETEFDYVDWLILALVTLALCSSSVVMLYLIH